MRLVLFDVDGTLIDSQRLIVECMHRAFADFGQVPADNKAVRGIIGLSLDFAIAQLLSRPVDPQIQAMSSRYKQHWLQLHDQPQYEAPFYPGMRELLDELALRADLMLGLVTGKSRLGVARLLDAHGLDASIVVSRTADDCPSKPHPAMVLECCEFTGIAPSRAVVIGDTIFDMQMARAAGADALGVAWGYHEEADLVTAGARAVLQSASAEAILGYDHA